MDKENRVIHSTRSMLALSFLPFLMGIAYQIDNLPNILHISWPLSIVFTEGMLYSLSMLILLYIIYRVYGTYLLQSLNTKISFFSIPVTIKPLSYLIALSGIVALCTMPFFGPPTLYFLQTIMIGPTVEDLLSRSFFIKYSRLDGYKFLFWASLLAFTFSINHWLYEPNLCTGFKYCLFPTTFFAIIERIYGHFCYGFAFTLIVYKTKRFEIATIIHILSNLLSYVFRYSEYLGHHLQLALFFIVLLILAGSSYRVKNEEGRVAAQQV